MHSIILSHLHKLGIPSAYWIGGILSVESCIWSCQTGWVLNEQARLRTADLPIWFVLYPKLGPFEGGAKSANLTPYGSTGTTWLARGLTCSPSSLWCPFCFSCEECLSGRGGVSVVLVQLSCRSIKVLSVTPETPDRGSRTEWRVLVVSTRFTLVALLCICEPD